MSWVQILLVTEQGDVLEGTQTNFFAVIDDAVYTAKEGVLMGTVRGVLLEVRLLELIMYTYTSGHATHTNIHTYLCRKRLSQP